MSGVKACASFVIVTSGCEHNDLLGIHSRQALGASDSGKEVGPVTVGWGTFAYGLSAGVAASLAVVFVLNGARSRRFDLLMASFGVFGLASALSTIITTRLHRSSNLDLYIETFKLFGLTSLVSLITLVILVAAWTEEIRRWALVAFGIATAFIGALQLSLPNGLLAGEIEGLRNVSLLGEQFVVHDGSTSPWRPILDLYVLSVMAMLVVALIRGYRHGDRRIALLMTLSLGAGLGVNVYDSLVDEGLVDTPYLVPFGTSIIVFAAAVFLADRMARTDAQLHALANRLEVTVVERTTALISANDQLERQLAHQRRSNHNLASLGQAFEASNSLVGSDRPDARDSLERVMDTVGTTTGARSVELEIKDEACSDVFPTLLSWTATNDPDGFDDETLFQLSEEVRIADQTIGEMVARFTSDVRADSEARRYLDLAAEHFSGLINQLELVRQLTDTAVEQERQRIAMDLHDSVTQRMYSVAFLAEALAHSIDQNPEQAIETAQRVRELVLSSLAELRSMLVELRPTALDEADLTELLGELGGRLTSTSDLSVVVEAQPVPDLPVDVKVAFYRIAQEAVSNACRHSGAQTVSVHLHHDHDVTMLMIADKGVGFSMSEADGQGLRNITSRAALSGLELDASSIPGSGTTISVRWLGDKASSVALPQGVEV